MKVAMFNAIRTLLSFCLLVQSIPADARGEVPVPGLPPASVPVAVDDGLFHSEASLNTYLENCGYEVGYYAVQLTHNRVLQRLADREVCLASMVKVFCLTELFRQAEDGLNIDATRIAVPDHGEQTLRQAADLMIGISDNPATQALVNFLGRDRVNAIPEMLGINGLSANVLPEESQLREVLDERVQGERQADEGLPMHGTARAIAEFYEQLYSHQVISPQVSRDLLAFFNRHPKSFSRDYREAFSFAGKGGNILWTRPSQHFSMMGWAGLLTDADPEIVHGDHGQRFVVRERGPIALCVWGEWFPAEMSPHEQQAFLARVTDSLIATMEAPQRAAKRLEPAITLQL